MSWLVVRDAVMVMPGSTATTASEASGRRWRGGVGRRTLQDVAVSDDMRASIADLR